MTLRYRGILYKCCLFQPEAVSQPMRKLRYRGVFYISEMRSPNCRRTGTEGADQVNSSTQSDTSQGSCAMHNERIGVLYKLYCMGWRNGSLRCLPVLQHWLLSIFIYYRRGYTEGFEWRQQHYLENQRFR